MWRLNTPRYGWNPLTIGRHGEDAPVWVWDDLELARRIVKLLNHKHVCQKPRKEKCR